MYGHNTGEVQAVHLEHLELKKMIWLNRLIGILKWAVQGNARILLFLSGGKIQRMEPSQVLKVPPPDDRGA